MERIRTVSDYAWWSLTFIGEAAPSPDRLLARAGAFSKMVWKPKPYVNNFLLEKVIRDDAYLSREERFFLLILKSHRNSYTLDCNPKTKWLISEFGRSDRQIRRIAKSLERKDYLVSVRKGFEHPNQYFFATDFQAVLVAYHCPAFQGNKGLILRANRKRWAVKSGPNVRTRSDTIMSDLTNMEDTIRLTKILYDDTYRCPHCYPQETENGNKRRNALDAMERGTIRNEEEEL